MLDHDFDDIRPGPIRYEPLPQPGWLKLLIAGAAGFGAGMGVVFLLQALS